MSLRSMPAHRQSKRSFGGIGRSGLTTFAPRRLLCMARSLFRFGSAVFAIGLIVSGLHVVANADESGNDVLTNSSFVKRPYVAAGAGLTHLKPRSPNPALTIEDDRDAGFHVAIGYDFSRLLSAEVYVASLGSASVGFFGAPVGDIDYQVYGASAIAYLLNSRSGTFLNSSNGRGDARREGLSLYGRFGIGGLRNDGDVNYRRDHVSHVVFGAGLEYGFSNGLALRGEYITMDTDAQYVTASLVKRFGKSAPEPAKKIAADKVPAGDAATTGVVIDPLPRGPQAPYDGPTMFRPIVPPYIYFDFDKSDLSATSLAKLDSFVDQMKKSELDIEIQGHTDWVAGPEYNMALSLRRAAAVRDYLVSRGMGQGRLETRGFGESRPISSNTTAVGRSQNRRVEMHLK